MSTPNRFRSYFLIVSILSITVCTGQEAELYKWVDSATGIENSALYNGPAYPHRYRPDGKQHQFLDFEYSNGSVVYDGQPFYDASLRYDIVNDELLLEKFEQIIPTQLVKQKVMSFTLNGKTFENLSYGEARADFLSGYYESVKGKTLTLYIKHRKNVREVAKDGSVRNTFIDTPTFAVYYLQRYHPIASKRDWIRIFNNSKQTIDNYYSMNRKMEKTDTVQFMTGLARLVDNTVSN